MSYYDYVTDQISKAQGYADDAIAEIDKYLTDITTAIEHGNPYINLDPKDLIDDPGSVTLDTSLMAQYPAMPASTEYPAAPSDTVNYADHEFPTAPVLTYPSVPTMHDITVPTFISNDITGITQTLPTFTDIIPAVANIVDGGQIAEDSLMQAAKAKLESNILNGGTMLDADRETDIWNRNKERDEQSLQDGLDKVTNMWAKLGWSLPDGLLAGGINKLIKDYENRRIDTSREIAIKQAQMEQDGMFKSIELASDIEKTIFGSLQDYAGRVFQASKVTADTTIEIFKMRIDRYNTLLSTFKADVEAYKTRLDAEVARAQAYKTQLDGLALVNQIDETQVKIYLGQLEGVKAMQDVYKSQIQAVAIMYDAERSKVERYKTQVEAYVAQIEAITKKYALAVEAFKSYISGYSASSDSQTKIKDIRMRGQIAYAQKRVEIWANQLKDAEVLLATKTEAIKSAAQVESNVVAGALSAAHMGLQLSGNVSFSEA
jgi:hypothetical protein